MCCPCGHCGLNAVNVFCLLCMFALYAWLVDLDLATLVYMLMKNVLFGIAFSKRVPYFVTFLDMKP
jgi:hypothetical protein